MDVAGVLLAAGAGRRYGMPKALVSYDGALLVRRGAETLAAAGCSPVLVVIGAAAGEVRAAAPSLTFVDNPDWASGMGSSLRAGLAAVASTTADAAVVLLVDMPGVTPAAVERIARHAARDALVMGGYGNLGGGNGEPGVTNRGPSGGNGEPGGRRGHPVLLGRDHWLGVSAAAMGDRGARDYLRAHHEIVRVEPVGDVADDFDLDVPEAAPHA